MRRAAVPAYPLRRRHLPRPDRRPAAALAAALLLPADGVRSADLLWGALSGVGSGTAMHCLNRGLSRGAMSVVVPLSAVTGVALSVLCGVLLLGDRPTPLAWVGIAVTVPGLWFVAGGDGDGGGGVPDGLLASAGVAVQYIALAQADAASGLWPVAAGRVAAVLVLLPGAVRHARRLRIPAGRCAEALLVGAGAALGLVLYLLAAQRQFAGRHRGARLPLSGPPGRPRTRPAAREGHPETVGRSAGGSRGHGAADPRMSPSGAPAGQPHVAE